MPETAQVGTEGQAVPAAVGTAQAVPAAAQAAPGASGQAGTGDDGFIKAPKDAFKPWGGRYGEAVSRATKYDQLNQAGHLDFLTDIQAQNLTAADVKGALEFLGKDLPEGVTVKQVLDELRKAPQQTPAGAGRSAQQQQTPASEDDRPLTVAVWKQLQAEQEQEKQTKEQTAKIAAAEKAEAQHWDVVFKDLKIEGGAKIKAAKGMAQDACQRTIAEKLMAKNPHMSEARALREAADLVPTQDDLAGARKLFEADWKDLATEIASAAAKGQAGLPGSSLGGGAGGPVPPPGHAGQLTAEQKREAVMKAIENAGKR